MKNNTFLSALLRGVAAGLIAMLAFSVISALALSFLSDPLRLLYACAVASCFAGGFVSALTAAVIRKEKPLQAGMPAGLILIGIILLCSLAGGGVNPLLPAGVMLLGSFLGCLAAPYARNRGKSKYRKLVKRPE